MKIFSLGEIGAFSDENPEKIKKKAYQSRHQGEALS
jgi:hypothetical protein